jgi:hypothetical protein
VIDPQVVTSLSPWRPVRVDFAVDRVAIGQPPPPPQMLFRFSLVITPPILILVHQSINDTILHYIILAVDSMIKYQTKIFMFSWLQLLLLFGFRSNTQNHWRRAETHSLTLVCSYTPSLFSPQYGCYQQSGAPLLPFAQY